MRSSPLAAVVPHLGDFTRFANAGDSLQAFPYSHTVR
ncbi:hypothetical protein BJ998_002774 [Kutzneria kofuensis]|uniref:Uncharacterized protein n=1 Tax=Kutzneria kofuensis TaxID=103725 RepID=A0A7W9NGZ4_9PSEU|nr:hypothetical protein [Kutzneria kofuensis]